MSEISVYINQINALLDRVESLLAATIPNAATEIEVAMRSSLEMLNNLNGEQTSASDREKILALAARVDVMIAKINSGKVELKEAFKAASMRANIQKNYLKQMGKKK